ACLMELAHHMRELPTDVGVDFVFFDGEEYIFQPGHDKYFFGSEFFAEQYRKARPKNRYVAAVLLDMIAGKDAHFPIEQNSWFKAGPLVQELWKIAAEQKCTAFRKEFSNSPVDDDHLALNAAGIPAVDIVPNLEDYRHWHRLSDVPANCSGETMAEVARVLTTWLQRVK
ncbi:MAG TPA: M28 family peptidase, partial [Gemmataceae bacterium]|nr:M28 family peptidase [Gemmataceae bacterium]